MVRNHEPEPSDLSLFDCHEDVNSDRYKTNLMCHTDSEIQAYVRECPYANSFVLTSILYSKYVLRHKFLLKP